jgi:hypothetical protein
VYAQWLPHGSIGSENGILIVINFIDAAPSLNEPIIISRSGTIPYAGTLPEVVKGDVYQKTATITVKNPQYSSIEWDIHSTTISVSGNSITLNSANTAYNNDGYHYLTVEAVSNGKLYSRTITFIVIP